MLRALLVLVLCANGLLWAYGQGWLAPIGLPLLDHREPHRMSDQVAPQSLRLTSPSD
jgi:hypothetical protein